MNSRTNMIMVLVAAGSVVLAAYILSGASLSIRTTDTSVTKDGLLTNAINVSGDGTAIATPDIIKMSFSVQERDFSTKEAMRKTNEKVTKVLEVAKKYGVKEEKIKTTQLSIQPRYDWTADSYVFRGYDASQTVSLEMAYMKDDTKSASILDETSAIAGIRINGVSFDVDNKKPLAQQARELAFQSAKEKAEQLANLSGVKLGKPISIVDQSSQYNESTMPAMEMAKSFDMGAGAPAPSTQLMAGELEHRIYLQVVFGIE